MACKKIEGVSSIRARVTARRRRTGQKIALRSPPFQMVGSSKTAFARHGLELAIFAVMCAGWMFRVSSLVGDAQLSESACVNVRQSGVLR